MEQNVTHDKYRVPNSLIFERLCDELAAQWQGSAAKKAQQPMDVVVTGLCTHDKQQLILSVSRGAIKPMSETWWFRLKFSGEQAVVELRYYDGEGSDVIQEFSLYASHSRYTLLGKGSLRQRPALIRLTFERQKLGWLWLQHLFYLDDDSDQYLLYRGIEMNPLPI